MALPVGLLPHSHLPVSLAFYVSSFFEKPVSQSQLPSRLSFCLLPFVVCLLLPGDPARVLEEQTSLLSSAPQ